MIAPATAPRCPHRGAVAVSLRPLRQAPISPDARLNCNRGRSCSWQRRAALDRWGAADPQRRSGCRHPAAARRRRRHCDDADLASPLTRRGRLCVCEPGPSQRPSSRRVYIACRPLTGRDRSIPPCKNATRRHLKRQGGDVVASWRMNRFGRWVMSAGDPGGMLCQPIAKALSAPAR